MNESHCVQPTVLSIALRGCATNKPTENCERIRMRICAYINSIAHALFSLIRGARKDSASITDERC